MAALGLGACALFPSLGDLPADGGGRDDVVGAPDARSDGGQPADSGLGSDAEGGMDAMMGMDAPPLDTGTDSGIPIQFVQINYVFCGNKTSCAAPFTNPVSAGNAILVVVSAWKNQSVTLTDTKMSTYKIVVGPADDPSYRNVIGAAFGVAGGANTVTATAASNTDHFMWVAEYRGLFAFDVGTFAIGNGVNASSGNLTTTQSNELLFGYAGYWVGGSVAPSFTARSVTGFGVVQDRLVPEAGTYVMTGVQNSSSNWAFPLGAFKGQ